MVNLSKKPDTNPMQLYGRITAGGEQMERILIVEDEEPIAQL